MSLQEKKTNKRHCCVPGCKTNYGEISSLHRFPLRDKNLYGKWLKRLKIRRPTREMYVCSRHFNENDFFGGWLAVEPNKRRLKRGVIPSLELPKSKVINNDTLLNTSEFAASLNLQPTKNVIQCQSSEDSYSKTKENEAIFDKQHSLKRKVEDLELTSTSDNLLVLKRVGEIKEAPEYQAKKKHEAQIQMKKMREFRKSQNKKLREPKGHQINNVPSKLNVKSIRVIPKARIEGIERVSRHLIEVNNEVLTVPEVGTIHQRNSSQENRVVQVKDLREISPLEDRTSKNKSQTLVKVSPQIRIKKIQSLAQSDDNVIHKKLSEQAENTEQRKNTRVISKTEMETIKKQQQTKVDESSLSQVKKVRVLSKAEVETIQKNPNAMIKNIRVYSNNQLNKTQDNSQYILPAEKKSANVQPQGPLLYQSLTRTTDSPIQRVKMTETLQPSKIYENDYLIKNKPKPLNDNGIFSIDLIDTQSEKQNIADKFLKIGKLMNDTIVYVDQAMRNVEKISSHKNKDIRPKEILGAATLNKNQHIYPSTGHIADMISNLERTVDLISTEISADEYGIPSAFETQSTQTETSEVHEKSIQTDNSLLHSKEDDVEKIKQENHALKEEVRILKARISGMERYLSNSNGQFVYVLKQQ